MSIKDKITSIFGFFVYFMSLSCVIYLFIYLFIFYLFIYWGELMNKSVLSASINMCYFRYFFFFNFHHFKHFQTFPSKQIKNISKRLKKSTWIQSEFHKCKCTFLLYYNLRYHFVSYCSGKQDMLRRDIHKPGS